MKKQIWLAALGYVLSVAMLLSFIYWFMKNENFSESSFLLAALIALFLSVGWGYIIASHLLVPQKKTQEHLLHLTKEIVHELNLPLATIQANSSMLRRNIEDVKAQKRLTRIEDASKRLARLYDELVYTIKKEMHEIERETFDLKDLIEERVAIFKEQGRNPFIVTACTCMVHTDRIGFEQVVDNLINNAMKYSPKEAAVKIVISLPFLKIIDHGIGMDEGQIVKIYEKYYQEDSQKEGEGIGLALVKAYCDRENIAIQIESGKGEGTTVTLDLGEIVV